MLEFKVVFMGEMNFVENPLNILQNHPLVLASMSPRRNELLKQMGIHALLHPVNIDETPALNEEPDIYVNRMSFEKYVQAVREVGSAEFVLTADTIVVLDNKILLKPDDENHAKTMLGQLSGKTHHVLTSMCLGRGDQFKQAISVSEVTFSQLNQSQINRYVQSKEPLDKAGSYGIQGLGAAFVSHLNGSYSGVMGLDVNIFYKLASLFNH